MQPIVLLSRERKACAAECGSKRRWFTARMMRACNSGLMCGSPFMTRLTLLTDTPALAATSRMVARAGWAWRNDIAGLLKHRHSGVVEILARSGNDIQEKHLQKLALNNRFRASMGTFPRN